MNYGEQGDALAALVCEELTNCQDMTGRQIMASRVLRAIRAAGLDNHEPRKPMPTQPEPMTDEQVAFFEHHKTVPYGKYAGQRVGDVPLDYLVWLVEDTDDFKEAVRMYLENKRIAREAME